VQVKIVAVTTRHPQKFFSLKRCYVLLSNVVVVAECRYMKYLSGYEVLKAEFSTWFSTGSRHYYLQRGHNNNKNLAE
jgi:hypothetical protein